MSDGASLAASLGATSGGGFVPLHALESPEKADKTKSVAARDRKTECVPMRRMVEEISTPAARTYAATSTVLRWAFRATAVVSIGLASATAHARSDTPWTPAPVAATCDRLVLENARELAANALPSAPRSIDILLSPDARSTCIDAGTGAWLRTLHNARGGFTRDGFAPYEATMALRFVRPDGSVIEPSPDARAWLARTTARPFQTIAFDDFDDDQTRDAIVLSPQGNTPPMLFTVRGDAIVHRPIDALRDANEAVDVDRDGDLDLVHTVVYSRTRDCVPTIANWDVVVRWTAIRERSRLLVDTDESRAFLRAQCPSRPSTLLPPPSPALDEERFLQETLRRIACTKVWGATDAAIETLLPAQWPLAIGCHTRAMLLEFARSVQPPITLRPMPAPTIGPRISADALPEPPPRNASPVLERFDLANTPRTIAAECSARTRANRARLARASRTLHSGLLWDVPVSNWSIGRCVRWLATDAWFDDVQPSLTGYDLLRGRPSRVGYLHSDGTRAWSPWAQHTAAQSARRPAHVVGAFDFDHDGRSEAIVETLADRSTIVILTVRDNAVVRYPPAAQFTNITDIADVDDDGQLDLVLDFDGPDDRADSERLDYRAMFSFVAHGRRDGTFSLDDGVTRAQLLAQCPSAPTQLVYTWPTHSGPVLAIAASRAAIACARVRRTSAESLVQRIWAEAETSRNPMFDRNVQHLALDALWRPTLFL